MNEDGYTLAELISEFYKRHHRENSLDEMKIIESWKSVVGGFIAAHTLDLRITKGILYVKVDADSFHTNRSRTSRKANHQKSIRMPFIPDFFNFGKRALPHIFHTNA